MYQIVDKQSILLLTLLMAIIALTLTKSVSSELSSSLLFAYSGYVLREATSAGNAARELRKTQVERDITENQRSITEAVSEAIKKQGG